jgi:DNA-binding transcriptional MocR family regulator
MTPADEQVFITLWTQGASQQNLAARLGVPVGTIKSRASALARQGKIQPRPRGGAYPHQRARQGDPPVQSAVQGAVHMHRSSAEPLAVQSAVQSTVQTLQGEVEELKAQVSALAKAVHDLAERPVQNTGQITALPPMPPSKSTRWNLWLPTLLQDEISRIAADRGIPASQLVKEWLWEKLQPHVSSTP